MYAKLLKFVSAWTHVIAIDITVKVPIPFEETADIRQPSKIFQKDEFEDFMVGNGLVCFRETDFNHSFCFWVAIMFTPFSYYSKDFVCFERSMKYLWIFR